MRPFDDDVLPGRVIFGLGSRTRLAEEVDRLGLSRVLLVVGPSNAALAEEVEALLGERSVGRFTDLAQHVPEAKADAARARARELGADVTLSIGGGTAIGFAKAIALVVPIPQIALPTTYAGSEMTPIWGLSDGTRKWTGHDPAVQPRVVVYDPELTLPLPPAIAGASGMNALAHAVEALYAPGATPISALVALEAVRLLERSLPALCSRPDDLDARIEALYGAHLAACALAVAGTALHHKTCHVLGGMFGLDHAGMNAVLLPHALRYNEPAIPDELALLADALGDRDPVLAVYDLARTIGAPHSLAELGMPRSGVETAVPPVVESTAANIRPPEPALVERMLRDAYDGRRPDR